MFDALLIVRALRDTDGAVVDFAYEYANAAIAHHTGYEPSELVGSTMLSVAPSVRNLELFPALVDVVETGEPMDHEVDWLVGPRTTGSFELRARRIEERIDERIALTIRNVTEHRELESFVATSEAHLRQVIDALPVGVTVVDSEGTAVFVNAAGRRIVDAGFPGPIATEDLPQRFDLYKEFTGETYPAEELGLARALRTGRPARLDDVVMERGDERISLETHATPLFASDGSISGAVNVFEDVSQRREHEARLARVLADQAAANERLDEFAAMAAHDLVSPLRVIGGFAELLRDRCGETLGSDAQEWIEFIQADAVRMRALIEDLLAYARAGAALPPASRVDLDTVVAEVAQVLESAFAARGATLTVEPLPKVVGEQAALLVVFRNLVGNALKFLRDDAPGVVQVSARHERDAWVVSVSDNGVGVPEHERESLFLPFHRGEASAKRGGNGLGLSICRRIVEQHGGRMWHEPSPTGGAVFCFTLDPA